MTPYKNELYITMVLDDQPVRHIYKSYCLKNAGNLHDRVVYFHPNKEVITFDSENLQILLSSNWVYNVHNPNFETDPNFFFKFRW